MNHVRVEALLSRLVHDPAGERVGRIEELHTATVDGEVVVREYRLGPDALFERISTWLGGLAVMRLLRLDRRRKPGLRVPWRLMDLSDPRHPRVTVPKRELERV